MQIVAKRGGNGDSIPLTGVARLEEPPSVQQRQRTMEDFWVQNAGTGYPKAQLFLTRGRWKDDVQTQTDAIRFLVEEVTGSRSENAGKSILQKSSQISRKTISEAIFWEDCYPSS